MPALSSRALLALALLVLIWGYSWIVMKQVLDFAGPFDFAALRYTGGVLVLFLLLLVRGEKLSPPPLLPTLIVGLAQTTGFQALAQVALLSGGAGKVSLYCYTMPFWVVLLAWWWLDEKPTQRQWLGLTAAIAGLALVIAPWQGLTSWASVGYATAGGIAWAIGTVVSKQLFTQHSPSPVNFTAWQMLLGAVGLCLLALAIPQRSIEWSGTFVFGLLYSIFLSSSLAWAIWVFIVRELPTSVAGLSGLLVPIAAILMAWGVLQETPSGMELAGMGLIMAGLFVVRGRRPAVPPRGVPTSPGPGE